MIKSNLMLVIPISEIRLVDGGMRHKGRVEMLFDGMWIAVCSSLNELTADIACRQLGFSGFSDSYQGDSHGGIQHFVDMVICHDYRAPRLQDCIRYWHGNFPQTSCLFKVSQTVAWLQCEPGNLGLGL